MDGWINSQMICWIIEWMVDDRLTDSGKVH